MTISNYFFGLVVVGGVFLAAAMMWPTQAPAPADLAQPETIAITGCLQAGESEGAFVLTADDKQAYQVTAAEDLSIGTHVNHRVELSGTVEKTESSHVLKANGLKIMATSCEPPS